MGATEMRRWEHHLAGERLSLDRLSVEPKPDSWTLQLGPRRRALILRTNNGFSWTVGRRGEQNRWFDARHLEDAQLFAETSLEDMPEIGPLEVEWVVS